MFCLNPSKPLEEPAVGRMMCLLRHIPTRRFTVIEAPLRLLLRVQIISSSAPCGDFYFLSCWSPDSKRKEAAASRTLFSSKRRSSAAAVEVTSDLTHLLKTCSELDLNIIVIWKVRVVEMTSLSVIKGFSKT